MSHVYFTEIRMTDTDDYVGDIPESPTRQRPRLTRRQASEAWQEERTFMFFSKLMRETTSYSAYEIDDLMNGTAQERNFQKWSEQIEHDRLEREYALAKITREIAEHKLASHDMTAERRQDQQ